MANSNTDLPTYQGETPESIRKSLEQSTLSKIVADKMGVEQFIEAALMLLRSPRLMKCTKESVMGGLLKAAIFNFRISQELGQCWLVPRYNKNIGAEEAVFQIGYKGWMELAMRSNKVESFDYGIAWERDVFKFKQGTSAFLDHEACKNYDNRGKRTHVWAGAYMIESGRLAFHVSPIEEVERHRLMSDTQKDSGGQPSGMWHNHYDQMAIRVPMRYLCQLKLPKSVEIMDAIEADESVTNFTAEGAVVTGKTELLQNTPVELHDDYLMQIEACKTQSDLKELWEKNKSELHEDVKPKFYELVNDKYKSIAAELLTANDQTKTKNG